jgi:hypothetical protein
MIIRISPDLERARSLFKMSESSKESILRMLKVFNLQEDQTWIAKEYYEVIRQLVSSIMLIDGFKAIGENAHKETLDYLRNYHEFTEQELILLHDLRIKRNQGMYEGKFIKSPYIERTKDKIDKIIDKLKKLLRERLI